MILIFLQFTKANLLFNIFCLFERWVRDSQEHEPNRNLNNTGHSKTKYDETKYDEKIGRTAALFDP